MIEIENSSIKFYDGTKVVGDYKIEKESEIENLINEKEELENWDYFEYTFNSVQEEEQETGRYFRSEHKVNVTETREGWEKYLDMKKELDAKIERLSNGDFSELSELGDVNLNGHSEDDNEDKNTESQDEDESV